MAKDKMYCFEVIHCGKDPKECPMIGAVQDRGTWFATFHDFGDLSLKCQTQGLYLLGPMASIHELTRTDVKVVGKYLLFDKDEFLDDIETEFRQKYERN